MSKLCNRQGNASTFPVPSSPILSRFPHLFPVQELWEIRGKRDHPRSFGGRITVLTVIKVDKIHFGNFMKVVGTGNARAWSAGRAETVNSRPYWVLVISLPQVNGPIVAYVEDVSTALKFVVKFNEIAGTCLQIASTYLLKRTLKIMNNLR
jgi:hypothetical protein